MTSTTMRPRQRMTSTSSQSGRVQAAVVRVRAGGRAVEQGESIHEQGGGITYRSRRTREGPGPWWRQRRPHPRKRDMRPEWPSLHLVPHIGGGELHVVMQQLEPRLARHPDPYDA